MVVLVQACKQRCYLSAGPFILGKGLQSNGGAWLRWLLRNYFLDACFFSHHVILCMMFFSSNSITYNTLSSYKQAWDDFVPSLICCFDVSSMPRTAEVLFMPDIPHSSPISAYHVLEKRSILYRHANNVKMLDVHWMATVAGESDFCLSQSF